MKKGKFILILLLIIVLAVFLNIENIVKHVYPYKYSQYIEKYSQEYNVDPYMVAAVVKTESNFNKDAKSHKDAVGLMQITPDTAKWVASKMGLKDFNIEMLYNPEVNIKMGCWYIDNLKKEFKDDMNLVLAAYNGGRGNVKKWLQSSEHSKDGKNLYYIPFKETDKYVKKVQVSYKIYKALYGKNKESKVNLFKLVIQNMKIK
ncbi:lytic transglycosylase domain-containing protein [Haloimpatiens sp. FM7330]|uniref:lytic transglycosylase domain-containing protein n=1 Tax=Haloimpatiens sp. FM7330 TaxID=3298610 RepID=UPI003629BDA2